MKKLCLLIALGIFVTGCATPKGVTTSDRRDYVLKMKNKTLTSLYKAKPETKDMIQKGAGYGVFSNIGSYFVFVSTGGGYGIVTDNETGNRTYMKMAQVGAGLGVGVKDFRLVFIFRNKYTMHKFVEKGWEFGGQVDAAIKSGEKGGAVGGEMYIDQDIIIYQLTEAGVALQATVAGTKYWRDKELN